MWSKDLVQVIAGLLGFLSADYSLYGKDMVEEAVKASVLMNVPIEILLAQSYEESRHSVWAVGKNGKKSVDRGLMQINSRFEKHFSELINDRFGLSLSLKEKRKVNFLIGAFVLRKWYDTYGDWRVALIAYNGGPGRIQRGVWLPASVQYADRILELSKPVGMLSTVLPSFASRVYGKKKPMPTLAIMMDLGVRMAKL